MDGEVGEPFAVRGDAAGGPTGQPDQAALGEGFGPFRGSQCAVASDDEEEDVQLRFDVSGNALTGGKMHEIGIELAS
ncbi:hypothetical protein [Streptomyces mirabilis]|uniref:hypothetical protein n=1 Tax=Streptomyces mirabilis TaxID=68239 RepID=UPI003F69ADAC